jgi:hypothetical protein
MMKNISWFFSAIFILGISSLFAQVQFFEKGNDGIVPYIGLRASSDIQELKAGIDYTIEGKVSLGCFFLKPLSDTLYNSDPNLSSSTLNPHVAFEIIEPDKAFPLSFVIKASYEYTYGNYLIDSIGTNSAGGDSSIPLIKKSFYRNVYSGSPILTYRFYLGENGLSMPGVSYKFNYVVDSRQVNDYRTGAGNVRDKPNYIWHDFNFELPVNYMFSNVIGIAAHPEIGIRIDENYEVDLIFALNLGVLISLSDR